MKVLIIEDNPEVITTLIQTLELRLPEVDLVSTFSGEKGVDLVKKELPDVVILDLGLPDIDGYQVLQRIRGFSNVLVMILTVRGEEDDRVRGLEEGADDYMTKPFSPRELVARLRALLRRSQIAEIMASGVDRSVAGDKLRINFNSETVSIGNTPLKLGPREYELLYHLATNEGKVLSKEMLLKEVFPDQSNDIRYLEVYINKLREKLGEDPYHPKIIISEGRTGYKFVGA
jgi:two-component system KDP operon response regulator KdpE